MSRLIYNLHTFTIKAHALAPVNKVYHRVLRRITSDTRHQKPQQTDYEVRMLLGCPAIEAVLGQKRLLYMRRLAIHGRPFLLACLSVQVGGKTIPWTEQCVEDLAYRASFSDI